MRWAGLPTVTTEASVRFARFAAVAALVTFTRCGAIQPVKVFTPTPSDAHQVVIWDYKFQPEQLTVPVGTTVTWVNRDMAPHTATHRTYSDEPFDTGSMPSEQTYSHTFRRAGTYADLCALHQGMRGTIVVQ
ncbi:MAG: hypothetical protein DMD49_03770 [Gemmatimonadetes bacterium]|nr:MAG: hypothetical protein DMD49_03770 [Gemmatimonadota bacterium]